MKIAITLAALLSVVAAMPALRSADKPSDIYFRELADDAALETRDNSNVLKKKDEEAVAVLKAWSIKS
ncbi:MAG: hypothetical protein Q9194_000144 [Teloschistes cf. exilis]